MRLLQAQPSFMPATTASELLDYQHEGAMQGQPVSVVVAAGPYTLDSDMHYEPFDALMGMVRNDRPDALILVSGIT